MNTATAFAAGLAVGYTAGYLVGKKEQKVLIEVEDVNDEEIIIPIRRRNRRRPTLIIEEDDEDSASLEEEIVPVRRVVKEFYTTTEVTNMTDSKLLREFARITGCNMLTCKHCKKYTELTNWVTSIRRRCEKKGLYRDMTIPKTCDQQSYVNDCCNDINNKAYPLLRASNLTDKQKSSVQGLRKDALRGIGVDAEPYRYK